LPAILDPSHEAIEPLVVTSGYKTVYVEGKETLVPMTEEEKKEELKVQFDSFEDFTFSTIRQEGKVKKMGGDDDKSVQKTSF
jgi:hypothetical protein